MAFLCSEIRAAILLMSSLLNGGGGTLLVSPFLLLFPKEHKIRKLGCVLKGRKQQGEGRNSRENRAGKEGVL